MSAETAVFSAALLEITGDGRRIKDSLTTIPYRSSFLVT